MARQIFNGIPYHVISRGNNRQWIFNNDDDFNQYLHILKRYKTKYSFRIYHWVLMNNHVHMILEGENLSKVMHGINLCYAQWIHRKNNTSGHIWEDRFKSFAIEREIYLLECGRYIERNPVRASISGDPGEYRWSSYNVYAKGLDDKITDIHEIYESLGKSTEERQKTYISYVLSIRAREEEEIKKRMKKGFIGTDSFAERLKRLFFTSKKVKPK